MEGDCDGGSGEVVVGGKMASSVFLCIVGLVQSGGDEIDVQVNAELDEELIHLA